MNPEAPYDDVDHALRKSYALEARNPHDRQNILAKMQGGTVHLGIGEDQFEAQAQAIMTIHWVREHLEYDIDRSTIDAFFTVPSEPLLLARKEFECKTVSYDIYQRTKAERWYTNDLTREWAGLRRHHQDQWWSDHAGKGGNYFKRIRLGRSERGQPGVLYLLGIFLESAQTKLAAPMYDAGLLKYDA